MIRREGRSMSDKYVISTRPLTSVSALVSGLTSVVLHEVVVSKFPRDFFKKIIVATAGFSKLMEDEEVFKGDMPKIGVEPRFEEFEEPIHNPRPELGWAGGLSRPLRDHYPTVLRDRDTGHSVFAIPRRFKVSYAFTIQTHTRMQAADVMHYLATMFEIGGYFYHQGATMESVVPNHFMAFLFDDLGFRKDRVDEFKDWVRLSSKGSLTLKKRLATGMDTWMWAHKCNILLQMPDKPQFQAGKKGVVEEECMVTFTLSAEAWSPAKWALECDGEPERFWGDSEQPHGISDIEDNGSGFSFSYAVQSSGAPTYLPDGKQVVATYGFITDANVRQDTLDCSSLFPKEIRDLLAYLGLGPGVDFDPWELMNILVYRSGGQLLERGVHWEMDWKTMTLKMFDPLFNYAHSMVLYADISAVNNASETRPRDPFDSTEIQGYGGGGASSSVTGGASGSSGNVSIKVGEYQDSTDNCKG
jgi:hypothetical protein